MLLGIANADKKRLSVFIQFELKKRMRQDPDYTVDEFVSGICSKTKFKLLVQNKELFDSDIYEFFLRKLGYEYNYDDKIISRALADKRDLLQLLEKQNMPAFYQGLQKYLKDMESVKEYALESIEYECFNWILDVELNTNAFSALLVRFKMLDDYGQEICGYFLLKYIHDHIADRIDEKWLDRYGLKNLKALQNQFWILKLLIQWEAYYDASIYCQNVLDQAYKRKNDRLFFHTQITRLFIVMKIQPSAFEHYANQVLENPIIQEDREDDYVYEFYHVVGLHYFIEKNYEQAWHYFRRAMNDELYYFPEIIFLNHMATITSMKLPEELKEQIQVPQDQKIYQPIYRYFCLKNKKESYDTLETYLWDNCCKGLDRFYPSWVMKDIIQTEFEWIASQTGDKKYLNRFLEENK